METSNQTLTEKVEVFDYNKEMSENPYRLLLPIKGHKIAHELFKDIRKDRKEGNSSMPIAATYVAEGGFHVGRDLAYTGLALHIAYQISKMF